MTQRSFEKEVTLEDMVASIQKGDQDTLHFLIQSYKPFIAKCVSDVCKRYIDPNSDDEFSIGLNAFYSATQSYSPGRGSSFLSFAKLVISRRIIDDIRSKQKHMKAISLDETFDAEKMENPSEISAVKQAYLEEQDTWNRRQEIMDYKKKLTHYKLTLAELTKIAPKHKDARESAIHIARILYNNLPMRRSVQKKKKLPMKELVKHVNVSKKTLERNRKYILAIFIVFEEEYLYLNDYLKKVNK